MSSVLATEQYKRDVRRADKKHYDLTKLAGIVETLRKNGAVPTSHKLHGEWSSYQECHIAPDWLLIYKLDPEFLYLYRTGTHNELF